MFAKTKSPRRPTRTHKKRWRGDAIVLDRLLEDAKALENQQSHPVLDQMVNADVRDDLPIAEFTAASSSSGFGSYEGPRPTR